MKRRGLGLVVLLAVAIGAVTLALSGRPEPGFDGPWLRDVLIGIGTSALLVVPFYFLTRMLDQRMAGQVEALRDEVEERLEALSSRVAAQLRGERDTARSAFAALKTEVPTRDDLVRALRFADHRGLVERPDPRVKVSGDPPLCVKFWYFEGAPFRGEPISDSLYLELVDDVGHELPDRGLFVWEGQSTEEVFTLVGKSLANVSNEVIDWKALMQGLGELLEAADADPQLRPVVQSFGSHCFIVGGSDPKVVNASDQLMVRVTELHRESSIGQCEGEKLEEDAASAWHEACAVAMKLFPLEASR